MISKSYPFFKPSGDQSRNNKASIEIQKLFNKVQELLTFCPNINHADMENYQNTLDEIQDKINNLTHQNVNLIEVSQLAKDLDSLTIQLQQLYNSSNNDKPQKVELFNKLLTSKHQEPLKSILKCSEQQTSSSQTKKDVRILAKDKTFDGEIISPGLNQQISNFSRQKEALLHKVYSKMGLVNTLKNYNNNPALLEELEKIEVLLADSARQVNNVHVTEKLIECADTIRKHLEINIDAEGIPKKLEKILKANGSVHNFCYSLYQDAINDFKLAILNIALEPSTIEVNKSTKTLTITHEDNILYLCFDKDNGNILFNSKNIELADINRVITMCNEIHAKTRSLK